MPLDTAILYLLFIIAFLFFSSTQESGDLKGKSVHESTRYILFFVSRNPACFIEWNLIYPSYIVVVIKSHEARNLMNLNLRHSSLTPEDAKQQTGILTFLIQCY